MERFHDLHLKPFCHRQSSVSRASAFIHIRSRRSSCLAQVKKPLDTTRPTHCITRALFIIRTVAFLSFLANFLHVLKV